MTEEPTAAIEKCARELSEIFARAGGFDDTPIERIVSAEYAEDGRTFIVQVEMPGGVLRWFSFCEGEPVHVNDHGGT